MESFSLWEMIKTVANLVLSTPVFLITLIVGIVLLVAMILSVKSNKKIGKALTLIIYIFLLVFILVYYNKFLYNLLDNLMNTFFMQIFFPNLSTYLLMLFLTIFILFYSILSQKINKHVKVLNMISSFIIIFLFILTLDVIVKSKYNIYEPLTVYSDKTLLILIEFSMVTFIIWIFVLLSIKIIKKLINKSNNKVMGEFLDKKDDDETEILKL